MTGQSKDSFKCLSSLSVNGKDYHYFDLNKAAASLGKDLSRLPFSLKVLLENLLRHEDGTTVTHDHIAAFGQWIDQKTSKQEVAYRPARVLMQDFTGVPAVVDLAAMRDAMKALGGDPRKINPLSPVDLVIDHSVMVDVYGSSDAFRKNVELEFERNAERYQLLKWAQTAFDDFRAVPPGTGICHQVNLEYLARTVWTKDVDGKTYAFPDTCVGTDSHTTMINGLAVLGWGVGGIEAEAAMLAQPVSMVIPDVVGFRLKGSLQEGVTATDLVLRVVQMLREKGVVGKFVEFYGPGLDNLLLADRATIANMAPEYGATCGFFPIDRETIRYLEFTGRDEALTKLVETYAKAQGMWRDSHSQDPVYTSELELDISSIKPSLAGPKRPQDRIDLASAAPAFEEALGGAFAVTNQNESIEVKGSDFTIGHGSVVIAAITSCTNTSNPSVMLAAGLVAKKALQKGLNVKPWVKTSLAPGSQVVTEYLKASGLQDDLDSLGFNLVGYGCTTCIGNSGPLHESISQAIHKHNLVVASVLSGNRNFEGRVSPDVRANYLASPPLVVAYAIAGNMRIDITREPLGKDKTGKDVYLKDIWPSNQEINEVMATSLTPEMFKSRYADVFKGPEEWQKIKTTESFNFAWQDNSTYIKNPPFFTNMSLDLPRMTDIKGARPLAVLGDSVTTDHISPAGSIKEESPAGRYLKNYGIAKKDFNSYGSRRGNHEVMMRGTFANIRIRNEMLNGIEGGYTKLMPSGEQVSIYDAAMTYQKDNIPLVIIAGKEYGTGSSRDWAAKGTALLGVKAVITESFERIHRSNLIGMGVLPLQFADNHNRINLKIDGSETFDIPGVENLRPQDLLTCKLTRTDGSTESFSAICRIDTEDELQYFLNGGILQYVLRRLV